MKSPNLLALSAAVLITVAGLASMQHAVSMPPASEINGIHVTDLAPVNVTPSAEERRAAALLSTDVASATVVMPGLGTSRAAGDIGLIGSRMAMPYYSFSSTLGRISKE